MSAVDGNGTSRPRIDSYHVHTDCPQPHENAEMPSSSQTRALRRSIRAARKQA